MIIVMGTNVLVPHSSSGFDRLSSRAHWIGFSVGIKNWCPKYNLALVTTHCLLRHGEVASDFSLYSRVLIGVCRGLLTVVKMSKLDSSLGSHGISECVFCILTVYENFVL